MYLIPNFLIPQCPKSRFRQLEINALQIDRKHCTDDFSRQINFILIFNLLNFKYL